MKLGLVIELLRDRATATPKRAVIYLALSLYFQPHMSRFAVESASSWLSIRTWMLPGVFRASSKILVALRRWSDPWNSFTHNQLSSLSLRIPIVWSHCYWNDQVLVGRGVHAPERDNSSPRIRRKVPCCRKNMRNVQARVANPHFDMVHDLPKNLLLKAVCLSEDSEVSIPPDRPDISTVTQLEQSNVVSIALVTIVEEGIDVFNNGWAPPISNLQSGCDRIPYFLPKRTAEKEMGDTFHSVIGKSTLCRIGYILEAKQVSSFKSSWDG